jgi:hypothetical protein
MTRKKQPLSDRHKRLYVACVTFFVQHQAFPTNREIIAITDVTSTSVANYYLDRLVEEGLLKKRPGKKARGFSIVGLRVVPPDTYREWLGKELALDAAEEVKNE